MHETLFNKQTWNKVTIGSPTSIMTSANPVNRANWKHNDKIDLNEFPILNTVIDRFDPIFPFKKRKSKEDNDYFIDRLSEVEEKKDRWELSYYTEFLIKSIQSYFEC